MIRSSGLRSDGQLRQSLEEWRERALTLCNFQSVEDTQQIILAAASIERARFALNHEKFIFFKHLCTPGHELRQKFDELCDNWVRTAGCPMMASQKAQMAVVCFLVEEHAKKQFKHVIGSIRRVSQEFFLGLEVLIRSQHVQEAGDGVNGCWYNNLLQPMINKLFSYTPDAPFVPRSEEFNRKQLDHFFGQVLSDHQKQGFESCKPNDLISDFSPHSN